MLKPRGFIYPLTSALVRVMYCLNLVELFKLVAKKLATSEAEKRSNVEVAIDIYVVLKWVVIISFWLVGATGLATTIVSWYLLCFNLFTYLYYHVWDDEANTGALDSLQRIRRRFVNSVQAFGFSILVHAYFYDKVYVSHFKWTPGPDFVTSWYFSIGNALTVTYGDVTPCTPTGKMIAVIQLIGTFFFVTTVIAKTLASVVVKANEGATPK